jgi:tetratricopeptide (TPR) repeat protein
MANPTGILEKTTPSPSQLFDRGNTLFDSDNYTEAIATYEQAVAINPQLHEAWYNRGVALASLGRYADAIESYNQALALKLEDQDAWYSRGNALFHLGQIAAAVESYDQSIAMQPQNPAAWQNKGYVYYSCGQYSQAIHCYEQAIACQPDKYDAWHNKGLAQFVAGNYAAAIADWQQTFNYSQNPAVPRYCEETTLIREFIVELLPRFGQRPVRAMLPAVIAIYRSHPGTIADLGRALVQTLELVVDPATSRNTAHRWLELWQSLVGTEPEMGQPLALMERALAQPLDTRIADKDK